MPKKLLLVIFLWVACEAQAQVSSHCSESERVVFSCTTAAKKIISFCASRDTQYLQYRFGLRDKIELIYPANLSSPKGLISAEEEPMPLNDDGTRDESTSINFKIGSFAYALGFSALKNYTNSGKKKDFRENIDASLIVKKKR